MSQWDRPRDDHVLRKCTVRVGNRCGNARERNAGGDPRTGYRNGCGRNIRRKILAEQFHFRSARPSVFESPAMEIEFGGMDLKR